jgi:hypothetical protein
MAQTYSDIEDDHSGFFDDDFVAGQAFYAKLKHGSHTGTFKVRDGSSVLEAKLQQSADVQDTKVDGTLKLSSTAKHQIEGEWDLHKFAPHTTFKHTTNVNSETHDHDTTFSLTNTGAIENVKNTFDFVWPSKGQWSLTHSLGYFHNTHNRFGLQYTYDGEATRLTSTKLGLLVVSNDYTQSWITHESDGNISSETDWKRFGKLGQSTRFTTTSNAKLGFDWVYDLKERTSDVTFGVHAQPLDGLSLRAKSNQKGEIEASAKVTIANNWDFLFGTALNGSTITSKGNQDFGFALEGKIQ